MTDDNKVQTLAEQYSTIPELNRTLTSSHTNSESFRSNGEELEHQEEETRNASHPKVVQACGNDFIDSKNSEFDVTQDAADFKLKKSKKRPKNLRESSQLTKAALIQNVVLSSEPLAVAMNPTRLFVASLGNPPPYSSTRHSAGHILLKALSSQLLIPSFQKSKPFANGLTSFGSEIGRPEFTLWQSPSLMNVSGVALLKAYKQFILSSQMSPTDPMPGLVVLYDEMETSPAQLRLRRGATSAKGHNGLKSVQQSLQSAGLTDKLGDRFVKIGIGIGRPAGGSRASEDVSQYVLGQITQGERAAIDAKVPELIKMLDTELIRMSK